jgi:undecaprenyl-phosphate 4-deoxy-4-formamido-L-arabinose transferase
VPSVSVVVPVYNSAETLAVLVRRIGEVLRDLGTDFEVILVDDGSRDGSWAVISSLVQAHRWLIGIELMRNFGQHNATLRGIQAASKQVIVTLDDDLQNPPEDIPRLLATLAEGYDVVYGVSRAPQHGWVRNLVTAAAKRSLRVAMGVAAAESASPFRAFRTQVRDAFDGYDGPFVSIDVLLSWGTTRFGSVAVAHEPRLSGRSNYNFRKLLVHAVNMTTGFSAWPLRFASIAGFGFMIFGGLVLVYVVGRYALTGGKSPAGFPFLASIIAIFGGSQLFALGIMGEYLARLHFRSMGRPHSVIRRHTAGQLHESHRDDHRQATH